MSRIHEALKKAEQEREAARAEGILSGPEPEQPVLEIAAHSAARVVEENPRAPVSLDALASRCAHPMWTPERKLAQLSSATQASTGSEELRTLRSRLYQIRDRQPLRTVLITSEIGRASCRERV